MGREAVQLFRQLPPNILNGWIYVSVLNACSHSGLIEEAQQIFDRIPIDERDPGAREQSRNEPELLPDRQEPAAPGSRSEG